MIGFIVLYFAIGMLLVTRYGWDRVVWYREEEHLAMPLLIIAVIVTCFVIPILFIVELICVLIESFRNN